VIQTIRPDRAIAGAALFIGAREEPGRPSWTVTVKKAGPDICSDRQGVAPGMRLVDRAVVVPAVPAYNSG
jgi:hypothetical protein